MSSEAAPPPRRTTMLAENSDTPDFSEKVPPPTQLELPTLGRDVALGNGTRIAIMQEKDVEDAAVALAQTYHRNNPVIRTLGVSHEDFVAYMVRKCRRLVNEGLSLIITDMETGRVAAALVATDWHTEVYGEHNDSSPTPGMIPRAKLFAELHDRFKYIHPVTSRGEYVYWSLGSVNKDFHGHRITDFLLAIAAAMAKDRGFKGIVTESGHSKNQRNVLARLGFVDLFRIPYSQFQVDGKGV
eukprot:gnl/Hemi2/28863_TR9574_c0_g1_i1.p1 gnl/Hemi2/28863_TR9574_c0_g1~~gnl/Hemi2/28863_TR9574_c0_g1_i1.p1  ORF type:complete len:242 (+),score=27.36 gnl/Hemi2/28863_TR9574_c0_g1_i1:127-852(+)